MKIKIMFSVLSRANYSRVKSLIIESFKDDYIDPIVIIGCGAICEEYGSIINECKKDGIEIHESISILMHEKSKENMIRTAALGMIDFSRILNKYHPDIAITIADRYETISFAISCSFMNIPLIHLQGGEPTGSIDDKVRNSITQLADYHLACTKDARDRLIKWGESKERVFNIGCPSLDHIEKTKNIKDLKSKINQINLKNNVEINIEKNYLVLLFHPDTNKSHQEFEIVIKAVKDFCEEKLIDLVILNPNPDFGSKEIKKIIESINPEKSNTNNLKNKIIILKNLNSYEYINLIQGAEILVGNSSSGIRESSFLGIKSLNIGSRQKFRYKCENVLDVDICYESIYEGLENRLLIENPKENYAYGDGNSSKKILDLLKKIKFTIKNTKV